MSDTNGTNGKLDLGPAVAPVAVKTHGAKLTFSGDQTPEQAVREYSEFRSNGGSIEEASKRLGIHTATYRQIERMIALVDRSDLGEEDAALARSALDQLNETRQASPAYRRVVDLFARVYGDPSQRSHDLERRAAQRSDAFDRGCGALIEACARSETMDVPYLSRERARALDAELAKAVGQIRALRDRIKDYTR